MRKLLAGILTTLSVVIIPGIASAHVIVTPKQIGVGSSQTFSTSVPNEKEVPVTSLRLVMPAGLMEVTPTVKAGWDVTTKKSGDNVTEIDWNDGTIPVGMRDDFTFSAQAPAKATTLKWKAYQTYQDGTVVSWDQTPTSGSDDDDGGNSGPYSTTDVVNDLTNSTNNSSSKSSSATGAYLLSGLSLVVAIFAVFSKRR